jgi:DNA topoisomerase IB
MCFGHELGIVWYPTFDWIAYNRDGHINWVIMDNVYTLVYRYHGRFKQQNSPKRKNKHEMRTMVMNIRNPSGVKSLMYPPGGFMVRR